MFALATAGDNNAKRRIHFFIVLVVVCSFSPFVLPVDSPKVARAPVKIEATNVMSDDAPSSFLP